MASLMPHDSKMAERRTFGEQPMNTDGHFGHVLDGGQPVGQTVHRAATVSLPTRHHPFN
jgi:hypothetical protein